MKRLDQYRFWSYAATFGALWGAVEITVGAFLHAVKVPFSSVVLGATGAALLICLRALLPVRGVVLTAGLMCAGIKLLSPAGNVLGPMIAITVEAGIVELVLRPFGVTRASAATAGALVCLYCVVQKLVHQLIFMGMPIIDLYIGIAKQAEKMMGLPASEGAWVVGLFLSIVATIGITFGLVGARIGKTTVKQLAQVRS